MDGKTFKVGYSITIEGSSGRVVEGEVPLVEPKLSKDFERILSWTDELRAQDPGERRYSGGCEEGPGVRR